MLQFDIKRILHNPIGRILLSILLGLGLASLFHKVCKDKNCIHFHGPVIKEIDKKTFEFDDKCYQYEAVPVTCDDKNKKVIEFDNSKKFGVDETFDIKNPKVPEIKGFDPTMMAMKDRFGADFTVQNIQ